MDSHQTIDVIQRALTERKGLGYKSVTIDSLEGLLGALKHTGELQGRYTFWNAYVATDQAQAG